MADDAGVLQMNDLYDVAIIGAGTAGLSALREIRKQNQNFVIINDGPYGTTCARVGCMPSKALIEAAAAFHRRRHFEDFGIRNADRLEIDIGAVMSRVRRLRDDFAAGAVELTADLGSRNIPGRARFVAPDTLQVGDRQLRAKAIIIATGSTPIVPKEWPALGERLLTSDDLFERQSLPQSLAMIGMGPLGVELAQALARLGVRVTAFTDMQRIAGLTDPSVNERALTSLRDEFEIHVGPRVQIEAVSNGVRVSSGDRSTVFDAVFSAIGRRPNLAGLGLENLGVPLDERGLPPIDRRSLRIAQLPVYIAGDVDGWLPLQHEANDDGHIAGHNALREAPARFQRRTPLGIVFCEPQIAFVGRRHGELDPATTIVGSVDYSRQGRARIAAANQGLLRIYAARGDGRLLGAELCAPHGEHLAHLLAFAVEQHATVQQLLRTPFYHPTLEEGLRTALRAVSKQLEGARGSDLASCDAVGADALD
jgi:dihydrolipoamide dehydrogenase